MYIESLIRLADIISSFEERKVPLIDEKYHLETVELIKNQSEFLKNELEIKQKDPGPYVFGLGEDFYLTIFTPEHTDIQEWAAVARGKNPDGGEWSKNYRFNSMMGLISCLQMAVKESQNGGTESQEATSNRED